MPRRSSNKTKFQELVSPATMAHVIGKPFDKWKGNCYGVAEALLTNQLCFGKLFYGFYTGPIAETSMFYGRIARHAWIVDEDEMLDPTRWVFEDVEPYMFQASWPHPEYDHGMQDFRAALRSPFPVKKGDFGHENPKFRERIKVPPHLRGIFDVINRPVGATLTRAQIMWLCNAPMAQLGLLLKPFYEWVCSDEVKGEAWIPIDNHQWVFETMPKNLRPKGSKK